MKRGLRKRITFANHNLVSDGVFSEVHLILCRNVMIYLGPDLQRRVINLFENSLVKGGFQLIIDQPPVLLHHCFFHELHYLMICLVICAVGFLSAVFDLVFLF